MDVPVPFGRFLLAPPAPENPSPPGMLPRPPCRPARPSRAGPEPRQAAGPLHRFP